MSQLKRRSGLTFVEMLVTITLVVGVASAAVAMLSGGLRVWERVSPAERWDIAALIAFDRIRTDMRSVRPFALMGFEGDYGSFSFAGVPADGSADVGSLQRIGYYHDSPRQILCRSVVPFPESERRRLKEGCQTVLEDVESVRVSYAASDAGSGEVSWSSDWSGGGLPAAVKVEVVYGARSSRGEERSRSIVAPLQISMGAPEA